MKKTRIFKTISILCCALCLACTAFSQKYITAQTATGKVKESFEAAMQKLQSGDKNGALTAFTEVVKTTPNFIDAHVQRASILRQFNQFEAAEKAFETALALDENYDSRVIYGLALVENQLKKYEEAAQHFEAYANSKGADPKMAEKAKDLALKTRNLIPSTPTSISSKDKEITMTEPKSMGSNLNDPAASQYFPALTADGETLIFTRNLGNGYFIKEDFYWSKKVNGIWDRAVPITELNTNLNEGAQCVSADGQVMYFSACGRSDSKGVCDIYITSFKNGAWEKPRNVEELNSPYFDALPAISADKRTIYFTSEREGSKKRDIWYCTLDKNGKWGEAKNMGETINTEGDDQAPFIHPDGQTLYFASNGHSGLGGFDIFYTRKNPDGTWSKPENAGEPINTPNNEMSLSVSLDGKLAFFSRTRTTEAKEDIYYFQLQEKARPKLVTYVKATVRDATSKAPLSSSLKFIDANTREDIQKGETDNSGVFLVTLNVGKKYALTVTKQGYNYYSKEFDLTNTTLSIDKPYLLDIELMPIFDLKTAPDAKKTFTLNNVNFATAQTEPLPESFNELNNLVQLLNDNPTVNIAIYGHTDNVGSSSSNLTLSEKRAAAIKSYLITQGIAANRLSSKGFGETQPIDSNETDDGKARNRRTEFSIQN
jgi:outer membrane protein OmpA-like peptidoglycan-associated protein/predicted negative regulator of RcsB-dependent stress response